MKKKTTSLRLKNVSKTFKLRNEYFRSGNIISAFKFLFTKNSKVKTFEALKDINLIIKKGETIGIIGRNGSGKSTLVKIMSGAYLPDKGGLVKKNGKSILMSLKVGMNPELTARQNIYVNGSALGLRVKEIDNKFNKIVSFAELEDFVDVKVKNFSNGMSAKLSFSIAINANAKIMFLDEVFAVGDQSFRTKAIDAIEKNWLDGRTVVLVSHSMSLIEKYCDRVVYLKDGKIKFKGNPQKAIDLYNKDSDN